MRFLDSFENDGWSSARQAFESAQGASLIEQDAIDCFQRIIGELADPINGEALSIADPIRCGACGWEEVEILVNEEPSGYVEISDVTFEEFLAMPESDRVQRVSALLKECEG